jgi:hypothetical protein
MRTQINSVCFIAVKKNGMALQFVRVQSEHLCRIAVMQNIAAIRFVSDRFLQIMMCKELIQRDPYVVLAIDDPPEELVISAIRLDWRIIYELLDEPKTTYFIEVAKQHPDFFNNGYHFNSEFSYLVDDEEFFTAFLRGIYDQFTR